MERTFSTLLYTNTLDSSQRSNNSQGATAQSAAPTTTIVYKTNRKVTRRHTSNLNLMFSYLTCFLTPMERINVNKFLQQSGNLKTAFKSLQTSLLNHRSSMSFAI